MGKKKKKKARKEEEEEHEREQEEEEEEERRAWEFTVPTCSYRMGESRMGTGAAVIGQCYGNGATCMEGVKYVPL